MKYIIKMREKTKFLIGIFIISIIIVFFGCSSSPKTNEVVYREIAPEELSLYHYQQNRINRLKIGDGFKTTAFINGVGSDGFIIYNGGNENIYYFISDAIGSDVTVARERVEEGKKYTFYFSVQLNESEKKFFKIDRIEGLMPLEQAQAKVDQKNAEAAAAQAERAAEQEARRQAREEANRYDPSKFTVLPSDFEFRPTNYTSTDLFRAASNSRNLQIATNRQEALLNQLQSAAFLGLGGTYVLEYVSDLTFVRQNGTDIVFSEDDNSMSQNMTIDQRSGLQPGQKVRVYYEITRSPLTTWRVDAIERR